MTLADALNVHFSSQWLSGKTLNVLPQFRGNIDDSTKAQYDALEWCDTRPKPKWEDLVETMKLPSLLETAQAISLEARVAALEADVGSLKSAR